MSDRVDLKGIAKFRTQLMIPLREKALRYAEQEDPAWNEVWKNHLWGLPGPKHLHRDLSQAEEFTSMLMYGLTEIDETLERLRDCDVYVGRFPFRKTRVSRVRYLRHVIENYLHEGYILRERMVSFARRIARAFRQPGEQDPLRDAADSVVEGVLAGMKPLTNARSHHVHRARFRDDDLDSVATWALLEEHDDEGQFSGPFKWTYREVRKRWKETIRQNNRNIEALVDQYFDVIGGWVFDSDGSLRLPPEIDVRD